MAVQLETREVQVQQVNGHGFKSTAGDWLNVSKFAGEVVLPSVGARVVVSLDKAGFIRKVEPVAPAPPAISAQTAPQRAMGPMANPAESVLVLASSITQDDRGVVITRLAVLNTATAILSSGSRSASPADVLRLADQLEAWATR